MQLPWLGVPGMDRRALQGAPPAMCILTPAGTNRASRSSYSLQLADHPFSCSHVEVLIDHPILSLIPHILPSRDGCYLVRYSKQD